MNFFSFNKNLLDKTICVYYFFKKKLQREIGHKIKLGDTINPLNDISAVLAIDNTSNLKNMFWKIDKLGDLWDRGKADANLIRCLPGGSDVLRQGKYLILFQKKRTHYQLILIKKHLNLQLS